MNKRRDNQIVVYSYDKIVPSNKKDQTTDVWNTMDMSQKSMLIEISLTLNNT